MYKKILVPVDGSQLAEGVLLHAQALASLSKAEIVLLRVMVYPTPEFALDDPGLPAGFVQSMEMEARAYMEELAKHLRHAGYSVTVLIREGPVAETILDVAGEVHADLIAMSTHGRSGISRWLLGSVADRVANHSPVPVMLVRSASE